MLFEPLSSTPIDIWATPKMTAIFILILFEKASSEVLRYQEGSIPTGYTQPGSFMIG